MKHIILGTAGHVDHGKTSLIKALTGIDTDRLKEEKERGITIELGFASLSLPGGLQLGIVDVPGHERFIKNMVSGASGIDLVMMVIAADEGVMPQTKEHLQICSFLGIKKGLVVISKIDMVDEDWRELVMEDVGNFLVGSFLEGVPIVPVSAVTGVGLTDLVQTLDSISMEIGEETDPGIFRLPVDRVFTMKGFGTVITGTLMSGSIDLGEMVEILPVGGFVENPGYSSPQRDGRTGRSGPADGHQLSGSGKGVHQPGRCGGPAGYADPVQEPGRLFRISARL